jgi:predicted RNA binding protein YcfA (HicA-like mRNA interferase family)
LKRFSSHELIRLIQKVGWYEVHTVGSHRQFKHPTKKGRVTIPHPKKDLPIKTIKSILKQAGIEED